MDDSAFEKDNYMETGMPAATGELRPGQVVSLETAGEDHSRYTFRCDLGCQLQITAIRPNLVRVRYIAEGNFDDGFSYATVKEHREGRCPLEHREDSDSHILETTALRVVVGKNGLRIRMEDLDGTVLSEDEKGFHWYEHESFGGQVVITSRVIQSREHFYGLGDIPGHKNLRGQRRMLWGSDVYGYDAQTDPLYKNIPFFIGVHHERAYGVFFDNSFRTVFDFGKERPCTSSFWAQGGEMDYFFFAGPTVPEVVASYAWLTGTPEMPPLWSLGFHQCKWSYKSEMEIMKIAEGFRSREIPCDAIYVDIDYMDAFKCFTWNQAPEVYPNPARMTRNLAEQGIKTVAIIDPGIKIEKGYEVYETGLEHDVFCRRMDGPLMKGNVWPGPCYFPDFTNPKTRNWWADLFPKFIQENGVAGIWTDMNEPAVFNDAKTFPRDVRHDYDGHPCSHRRGHNVYGMQMARATQEGLKRALPDKRPFVITRSAFSGTQRYSSAWTGDIQSTWQHLRIGNVQCQRLALSGYSFVGTDIGGFSGKSDGELFIRWLQMGIFHPFCRVHSSGDANEQEPWSFGDPYTAIAKKFIDLRYRLLPYIYTVFEENVRTGAPMLRSLIYLDEKDPESHNRMEEFALGSDVFTCPISKPETDGRWLYLPRGRWYNFWNNEPLQGGDEMWFDIPLESTPLFIRAGAVLPLGSARLSSETPLKYMELRAYLDDGKATGTLYEDSGDGHEYREEAGRVTKTFQVEELETGYRLTQDRVGSFQPDYREYHLEFLGANRVLTKVIIDGKDEVDLKPGLPLRVPETFKTADFH